MKVLIYCTKAPPFAYKQRGGDEYYLSKIPLNGNVVASFELDSYELVEVSNVAHEEYSAPSCLTVGDLISYCGGKDLYAWPIKNLKILKHPLNLRFFGIEKAPQSYMYVKDIYGETCLLLSIKAEHVKDILNGDKVYEIRKTLPKFLKRGGL